MFLESLTKHNVKYLEWEEKVVAIYGNMWPIQFRLASWIIYDILMAVFVPSRIRQQNITRQLLIILTDKSINTSFIEKWILSMDNLEDLLLGKQGNRQTEKIYFCL